MNKEYKSYNKQFKKNYFKKKQNINQKKYYSQILFDNCIIKNKKIKKIFENENLFIERKIIKQLINSDGIYQYKSSKNNFINLSKKNKILLNSYIVDNYFHIKSKNIERNNTLYINSIEEIDDISYHIPFIHKYITIERNIFKIHKNSNIEFIFDNIFYENGEKYRNDNDNVERNEDGEINKKIENIKNYYFIINSKNIDINDYLIKEELNDLFLLLI